MIYFVVSFILGILAEEIFHFGWSVALLVGLVSVTAFLVSRFTKIFLIVGIALALGILRMSLADISPDPNLLTFVEEQISFEAIIWNEPDIRDVSTRYIVKLDDSKSSVLLVAARFPEFQYGDKIKVTGKLDLPKNFTNENGTEFDYISYLSKDKINFLIYHPLIDPISSDRTGLHGINKIISDLYTLKNNFIKNIESVVPEPNASLLAGLIFGAKQSLGEDLLEDFRKVGLIHIIVLSGYNITIIAWAFLSMASYIGKRNLGFVISVFGIILFALMVGLGATVIRASIMATIAILARYLGRPTDALRWLFIAGFLMLAWNPLTLSQDPSFQLSFMATLGLITFTPFISNFIAKKLPFITPRLAVREIIASTFAVQLFILPLLIKMSGSVSIISFLINPIVLPTIPLIMAFGALAGAFGFFVAPTSFITNILAWVFGALSYLLTEIIFKIVKFFADLPFASFSIMSLPLYIIFIWYLGYAFLFYKLKYRAVSSTLDEK